MNIRNHNQLSGGSLGVAILAGEMIERATSTPSVQDQCQLPPVQNASNTVQSLNSPSITSTTTSEPEEKDSQSGSNPFQPTELMMEGISLGMNGLFGDDIQTTVIDSIPLMTSRCDNSPRELKMPLEAKRSYTLKPYTTQNIGKNYLKGNSQAQNEKPTSRAAQRRLKQLQRKKEMS